MEKSKNFSLIIKENKEQNTINRYQFIKFPNFQLAKTEIPTFAKMVLVHRKIKWESSCSFFFFLLTLATTKEHLKGVCSKKVLELKDLPCGEFVRSSSENEFFHKTMRYENITCEGVESDWIEIKDTSNNTFYAQEKFFEECVPKQSQSIYILNPKIFFEMEYGDLCISNNRKAIKMSTAGQRSTAIGEYKNCNYTDGTEWIKLDNDYWIEYEEDNIVLCYSKPINSLNLTELISVLPETKEEHATQFLQFFNEALKDADINSCDEVSAFTAQVGIDTNYLTTWSETGDVSEYEFRSDLCNSESGDAEKYKGRGAIQLIGKCDYQNAGVDLGLDLLNNPSLASESSNVFKIASWIWKSFWN